MRLTVVIPCFNDGNFLKDAVNSVFTYTEDSVEIIIINDGSTDQKTLDILENYKIKGIKILSHSNKGLAFSRNRGIREAAGEYILPLDADNKIKADYIKKAIQLLDAGVCDIVYAKPTFFGEDIKERMFQVHPFESYHLFSYNFIDACAVYRKNVWEKTGGYDEKMPYQGHEDWELWLNASLLGFRFEFLDEELYDYRINNSSMIAAVSTEKITANHNYILIKHKQKIINLLYDNLHYQKFYENDQANYLRTSIKYFIKFLKKLIVAR